MEKKLWRYNNTLLSIKESSYKRPSYKDINNKLDNLLADERKGLVDINEMKNLLDIKNTEYGIPIFYKSGSQLNDTGISKEERDNLLKDAGYKKYAPLTIKKGSLL